MKKTTLLSLFTAGAIIATTGGTYAAWDVLNTSTTVQKVALGKAVNVTANMGELALDPVNVNEFNKDSGQAAKGEVTVDLQTVSGDLQTGRSIVLTPKVTFKEGNVEVAEMLEGNDYTVEIKKGDTPLTDESGVFEDSSTLDYTGTGNKYTVTVTPKNTKLAEKTAEVIVGVELK